MDKKMIKKNAMKKRLESMGKKMDNKSSSDEYKKSFAMAARAVKNS